MDPPEKGGAPTGQVPREVGKAPGHRKDWHLGSRLLKLPTCGDAEECEVMLEAECGPAGVVGFPGPGVKV